MTAARQADLVAVAHVYGPMETGLAFSLLEAASIPAVAQTGHMGSVSWHLSVALGGSAILVPTAEAEAARAVLADFRPERRRPGWPLILFFAVAYVWAGLPAPASGHFPIGSPRAVARQA